MQRTKMFLERIPARMHTTLPNASQAQEQQRQYYRSHHKLRRHKLLKPLSIMWEEDEEMDCPICLDPMDPSDHKHALMCTTKQCDFNFCHTCIESLITSSKDEYIEASDGNNHVKVWLHCPNCRSDLGPTIRETLILRKADFLLASGHLPDEELTASQLRMRNVIDEPEVQKAIVVARKREKDFFKQKYPERNFSPDKRASSASSSLLAEVDYEEIGVEADLKGVHQSFRAPKVQQEKTKLEIDKTLFRGLDFSMTEQEQIYVTELMTSGDAEKLANAAEILHGILNMERHGTPKKPVLNKRSSVFELIQEAEKAYITGKGNAPVVQIAPKVTPAQLQASMRRQTEYLKLHPLPIRMPKHVELMLPRDGGKIGLGFCDDSWNGTVMDAYSKITISARRKVRKKRSTNRGVRNVLSQGNPDEDFGDARIDLEKERVLVCSVRGEGGRMGILKGDVVTHLNGERFDGRAADLEAEIKSLSERGHGPTFTLVLNAERSVAEALRRRASVRAR